MYILSPMPVAEWKSRHRAGLPLWSKHNHKPQINHYLLTNMTFIHHTGQPCLSGGRGKSVEQLTIDTQGFNVIAYHMFWCNLKTFLFQASFYWLTYKSTQTNVTNVKRPYNVFNVKRHTQPFYGPFSRIIWVSQCRKKTFFWTLWRKGRYQRQTHQPSGWVPLRPD